MLSSERSRPKAKIAVLGVKGLPFTGGLEIIMEEIGRRFVSLGYGFHVFVRKQYMTEKHISKTYKGIRLRYSRGIHSKHLDAITHSFTALIKIISGRYDIIYINAIGISVLGFIPRLFGKKVIVQVHGLDFKREKWGALASLFLKFSCLTTVLFADRILCVSMEDKLYFDRRFGTNCIFTPNGVTEKEKLAPHAIREKWGLEENGYILFMARLVKEKGCHLLLEAYRGLETEKLLVIAGDNSHREPYSEDLKKQASDRILFIGFVDGREKNELLSNAYCYVLPSTLEAMPLSLLEAMNLGNCIIASDLPELKAVLKDDGLLFGTGDALDLREKLSRTLNDPAFVKDQGQKMIDRVRTNHNWDRIFQRYLCVVEGLTGYS